jgi:hypothetical protein
MLQDLSEEIRECYRHAEESRRWAEDAIDPSAKAYFLQTERRWLSLARNCEFAEWLSVPVSKQSSRHFHRAS